MNMTQAQLSEVLRLHAEWLVDYSTGKRADLSIFDMQKADLVCADLRNADLRNANFREADLQGANLQGANLRHANFSEADLSGATLSGADMRWTLLSEADLSDADLRGADLQGASMLKTNLSCADLRNANLFQAAIDGAILFGCTGVIDAGADPRGYQFIGIWHADGLRIKAGCRWFNIAAAKRHWSDNRDALARVAMLEALLTDV